MGAGGQGSEADQPGSGNEHKIISYGHAFSAHPGFNLLGFYDIDREKAFKAADAWRSDALPHWPIIADVIVIATLDDTHYEQLLKAIDHRLPPDLVICEKPICTDLEQAREIVDLYSKKNIPLMVNYTRRFLPYYDHLKQYGKPIYGTCAFNRGWMHTATHAIDFFNMIGCDNYRMIEIPADSYRVWDLKVYYKDHVFSEVRTADMPVWDYYDKSHWYIAENAYNFLEGKEPIKCTGENALAALEKCFELMEGRK